MRTLFIRADAGDGIGAGHVMRCLAVARAWMADGGRAVLLTCSLDEPLARRVAQGGIQVCQVPGAWPQQADLDTTLAALASTPGPNWLLLDGYHFDQEYMLAVQAAHVRVCALDDIATRPFFPAQLLVNPNSYAPRLRYDGPPGMRRLLGSPYVMLRDEFLDMPRPAAGKAASPGGNLLLTMGGGESSEALLEAMEILALADIPGLAVHVVAGFSCQRREALLRSAQAQPYPCRVSFAVEDMAPVLSWAQGAVSAAGGSAWELAFAGVPMALAVMADNQRLIASDLADSGAALFLGEIPGLNRLEAARNVQRLMTDRPLRLGLIESGRSAVDGLGPQRIVAAMKDFPHD